MKSRRTSNSSVPDAFALLLAFTTLSSTLTIICTTSAVALALINPALFSSNRPNALFSLLSPLQALSKTSLLHGSWTTQQSVKWSYHKRRETSETTLHLFTKVTPKTGAAPPYLPNQSHFSPTHLAFPLPLLSRFPFFSTSRRSTHFGSLWASFSTFSVYSLERGLSCPHALSKILGPSVAAKSKLVMWLSYTWFVTIGATNTASESVPQQTTTDWPV